MGQKKDIGTLFENKLNDGKKIPSTNLWEKINSSLDEEERRKKRIIYYWLVGGGMFLLLGFLLLFGNGDPLQSNSTSHKDDIPLIEESTISSEIENNKTPFESLKEDPLIINNESEEKLSKIDIPEENSEIRKEAKLIVTQSQTQQSDSKKTSEKGKLTSKRLDENSKVSKNYYYYNSSTGQQIITTNKKEIDSLISEQYKSLDSTTTNKTDILE
jgi:hypothetical protein